MSIAKRVALRYAKSFGDADVPGVFWLIFDMKEAAQGLSQGHFKGLRGISGDRRIVFNFLGVGRDAMLVMPGKAVVRDNKLTRVMYDKPEYLVSKNLLVLHRLMNKEPGSGSAQLIQNFTGYVEGELKKSGDPKLVNIYHHMNYGTIGGTFFGSAYKQSPPRIESVHDLARWYQRTSVEICKSRPRANYLVDSMTAVSAKEWEPIVRAALKECGRMYTDEGEWIVKSDTFKIPDGSKLLILKPAHISNAAIAAYLHGGPEAVVELAKKDGTFQQAHKSFDKGWFSSMGEARTSWEYFHETLDLVKQHNLSSKYRVSYLDGSKYEATRSRVRGG